MFDCEDPALPAATPAPVLVHKLELKLRPEDRKKSWFEQLNRNHVDLIANALLIATLIGIVAALSTLIFGNSREGIFCIVSEFVILFLLCVRIIGRSTAIHISSFRFAAPLTMAGLLLISVNGDCLPDALDAWQGKRVARNLHTLKQIQHAAQEHPSNKFLAVLLASHKAGLQSTTAVRGLIDNFRQDITLDALLRASTRDQLNKLVQDLRAAEARATLAWSDYLQIQEVERLAVEQAGREIYASDPLRLVPKVTRAYAGGQEFLRTHMDKTFTAIAALLSAKGNLAEFMASHIDQSRSPRLSGTPTVFADQATNDQLKKLIVTMRTAENKVIGLDRGIVNAEQNGLRTLIASAGDSTLG